MCVWVIGSSFLGANDTAAKIVRRGMVYGKAQRPGPKGLLFLSYQSKVDAGFLTQQHLWENSESFPDLLPPPTVGIDMVIAQVMVNNLEL